MDRLEEQSAINMTILSFGVTMNIATILFYFIIFFDFKIEYNDFKLTVFLMCLASFIEGCCEPYYAVMLREMDFSKRAKSESVAIFFKTVLTYGLVYKGMGLLAYALAQITYSLILFLMYTLQYKKDKSIKEVFDKFFRLKLLFHKEDRFLWRFILPQHVMDIYNFT